MLEIFGPDFGRCVFSWGICGDCLECTLDLSWGWLLSFCLVQVGLGTFCWSPWWFSWGALFCSHYESVWALCDGHVQILPDLSVMVMLEDNHESICWSSDGILWAV